MTRSVKTFPLVAFLRAVNVGGRTAKSSSLVKAFQALGFSNASAFLASGNVMFASPEIDLPRLKKRIESQLVKELGFETEVILRSLPDLRQLIENVPFPEKKAGPTSQECTINIVLIDAVPDKKVQKSVLALRNDYDDFSFQGRNLFWLCRGKRVSDSPVFQKNQLTKVLDVIHTVRNLRTIQRLVDKFD